MNKNLFHYEIRRNLMSLILWTGIITVLITVTMMAFPTFYQNQSKVMGMMSLVPKSALQFKGISNINDLRSVLGFYSMNNIIYMMVLGSIFSIVLSSNILLKEEYNKTAEYLLTRPITRKEIFNSKLSVVVLYIFVLNLVTAFAGLISMELFKKEPFNINAFFILSAYTFLLNLLFGAIGLFISTQVKRGKPITTFSIGLVLIFYFIYTISKISVSFEKIGYLSPFKYVNTEVVKTGYSFEIVNVVYFVGLIILLTGMSYQFYIRKDIYV